MLKGFLAVPQNIFAHITEVDIQLSFISVRVRESRVHEPELDVLNVRFLKVGVVQPPHNTCPAFLRVRQMATGIHFACADIVLTAFGRVVCEVENRQFGIDITCLLLVRINLILIDDTRAVVTHRIGIVTDMRRCVCLWVTKDRINGEPRQVRTVFVITGLVNRL